MALAGGTINLTPSTAVNSITVSGGDEYISGGALRNVVYGLNRKPAGLPWVMTYQKSNVFDISGDAIGTAYRASTSDHAGKESRASKQCKGGAS